MKKEGFYRIVLGIVAMFICCYSTNAQSEISFTNKVSFYKSGYMEGVRFVTVIPAPVTNEYQEISSLLSNCGRFIDLDEANKVLFYDGSFVDNTFDVFESFVYKTKRIRIDFNDTNNKNIITGVDPNKYLKNDGKYINTNNQKIRQIGDQLWAESQDIIDYAKLCYEYVATHFRYINGSWRTLTAILNEGGGECGDFTTLFVNLMRYKGIPARHNIGIWKDGGYHVWPDFYHEDYGWIPVDPTFKNSDPYGDYFGRYDGNLIIVSQGLTSFSKSDIVINNEPLQTYFYWYWYNYGNGSISGNHITSKDYQVDGIKPVEVEDGKAEKIFNLMGIEQKKLSRGINIVNGRKVFIR